MAGDGRDAKDTFVMCKDWEEHTALLTMEQRGQLLTAIFAYQNTGELPGGDPAVQMAFSFIRSFFDKSDERYQSKVRANQENGAKGGRPKEQQKPNGFLENPTKPKKPNGYFQNPTKPKQSEKTLTESDTDTDTESVTETESVTPPSPGGAGGVGGRAKRFRPPTLAEVAAYVAERASVVDPQGFIDFYASKGWMVGKTPMKDWKAACRNAEHWDRWMRPTASEKPSNPFLDIAREEGIV